VIDTVRPYCVKTAENKCGKHFADNALRPMVVSTMVSIEAGQVAKWSGRRWWQVVSRIVLLMQKEIASTIQVRLVTIYILLCGIGIVIE
jgi:hypothetical protein